MAKKPASTSRRASRSGASAHSLASARAEVQATSEGGVESLDNALEIAIGQQVRSYRTQLGMTVQELAKQAGMSGGMLSKIENGLTSPSLGTLRGLARSLNVPVTSLFRRFEEQRGASLVRAGEGLVIERRGTRAGHQYRLLGHVLDKSLNVEPYQITIEDRSEVFPLFQHDGVEFIHVLEGQLSYRHGNEVYWLNVGDSLFFDARSVHGPEELFQVPARFLSIIIASAKD